MISLIDQPTAMPGRKLTIGGAGAAILAPHLLTIAEKLGFTIQPEVAMWLAIGVTMAFGYMTRERGHETEVVDK